jgi:hypothetical protein
MSADDALGYVYLPFSTPSDDHYGSTVLAMASLETAWSVWMRGPANVSGTFRWPTTGCGTTTCRRHPI